MKRNDGSGAEPHEKIYTKKNETEELVTSIVSLISLNSILLIYNKEYCINF